MATNSKSKGKLGVYDKLHACIERQSEVKDNNLVIYIGLGSIYKLDIQAEDMQNQPQAGCRVEETSEDSERGDGGYIGGGAAVGFVQSEVGEHLYDQVCQGDRGGSVKMGP